MNHLSEMLISLSAGGRGSPGLGLVPNPELNPEQPFPVSPRGSALLEGLTKEAGVLRSPSCGGLVHGDLIHQASAHGGRGPQRPRPPGSRPRGSHPMDVPSTEIPPVVTWSTRDLHSGGTPPWSGQRQRSSMDIPPVAPTGHVPQDLVGKDLVPVEIPPMGSTR